MNVIVNLGRPDKNIGSIARRILTNSSRTLLKITGVQIISGKEVIITSCTYGAGMTLDCLEELRSLGHIRANDSIICVGSMGSLCAELELGDIVVPNPCLCAYYGYRGVKLCQDEALMSSLLEQLDRAGSKPKTYRHGSSFAVFDPHTNHATYKTSLYKNVQGLDCGEVFIVLQFAGQFGLRAGAVLYCSDSPKQHISDIGEAEFARRAHTHDMMLNKIAVRALGG